MMAWRGGSTNRHSPTESRRAASSVKRGIQRRENKCPSGVKQQIFIGTYHEHVDAMDGRVTRGRRSRGIGGRGRGLGSGSSGRLSGGGICGRRRGLGGGIGGR